MQNLRKAFSEAAKQGLVDFRKVGEILHVTEAAAQGAGMTFLTHQLFVILRHFGLVQKSVAFVLSITDVESKVLLKSCLLLTCLFT